MRNEMSHIDEVASAYYAGKDEARDKLATWMLKHDYFIGHGDTIEDLLSELSNALERDPIAWRYVCLERARKPIAWRYTCASGTFYTDDPRDVYDNPEVESWTALYSEEN
jgi:hypothetical protein